MSGLPIGRPRFVTIQEALGWHEAMIVQYGGSHGIRDPGLLESALAQPRQGFSGQFTHQFPFEMAAAYAFHLAKNHPFVDGNKRAALMCCGSFLRMNGWDLVSQGEEAADTIVAMVEGKLDKSQLAEWLRAHSRERASMELRDYFSQVKLSHLNQFLSGSLAGRLGEVAATATQTEELIPLARELAQVVAQPPPGCTAEDLSGLLAMLGLLDAVRRIAEDMGYEW